MSNEANKAVVVAYVEAFNARNYEKLRTLFAPDAVIQGVLGKGGLDVVMPIWRSLHTGLDMRMYVEKISAEANSVAVLFTERGRFVGPFLNSQPTGKSYEITAMEWFIVRDGQIHQRWGVRDSASIARQIGMTQN